MAKLFTSLTVFAFFSINSFAQLITVTSPNGGESWATGVEYTITWTDSLAENVKIELYKGGVFDSELFDSTESDGAKSWTIPMTTVPDSDYSIKITSVDSSNVFDFSDANFTIYASFISITVPNGGESWQAGTTQTITWTDNIPENISIDLYKAGVFNSVIVSGSASDGVRNWSIPFLQEGGSDYSVKITSVDNPDIFDFSDSDFTIVGGEVTVTAPNGGEDWLIGSFQNITWNEILVGNVRIDLLKSGVFHSEITGGTVNDSLYIWEIPSSLPPGSDYKVRISSVIEGSIFDFSDGDFTLSHEIIVTTPNGEEFWQAGTDKSITWTDNINDEVMIELYKGGAFHSVIATSTESDGLKEWSIPYTLESGSDYKVRISSVVDTSVHDISDSDFTIIGNTVTVTTPNGGEDWLIGSSQKISWNDNFPENVEIQLYKGGIFHSLITPSTASDGLYTWNISPAIESGSDYKIRIASVVDGNIFDFSDTTFSLSHQVVVTVPNGGELWQAGSSKDIEWTDNLTGNVKIELYKGGVFDTEITPSATSNGEYTWAIPITTTEGIDYRIKITSVDDSTVTDMSEADFTIFAGNIMVTSPNGGESWLAGSSQEITWSDNISGNVKIDLFKGGVFYTEIINSATSSGIFNWDIADTTVEGSDYQVKISSVENAALFDFSDADFTIFAGSITVTSPNGGESWLAGSSENITWIDNISENVTIDLYKGGVFHSVISTSTSSDGSREWDIPFTLEAGADYTVKITDVSNPNTFDFSDSNFMIVSSQITVISPNGGEQLLEGENYIISWNDNLAGNVEIQLFKGGVFLSQIAGSTPSDGLYTWEVSSSVPSGSDYKVKILSVSNGSVFDFSDSNFTVINQDLTVVTPDGGENWLTSTTNDITWTDDISSDVKIELYKAGVFYSEIVAATPSNGLYSWTIPDTIATASDYKIRITSVNQPVLFDESDDNFTIFTGGITVTSPNGGESWQAGSSQVITWMDNITEDVSIELYKGGVFHSVIDNQTNSDGTKDWYIPFNFEGGDDYQIKIASVNNPATIVDFSDSNFTIVANQVTVTSPNSGENWLASEVQMITWIDNFAGSVEIQLFKSDVFYSSIVKSTPSDGAYSWNIDVTTPSASDYKVKILSLDDGSVFDLSDSNFTIINNELRVVTPNGGESWLTNSTHDIIWTDDISGDVKIDLYRAGVFNSEVVAATPSDGSYIWTIPDTVATGTDYKVRITSVDQPVLFDESDANFTIFTGGITVVSPNGGESWQAGTLQMISWVDNITEDVTIDLYKGGVFHSVISTPLPSNGSFAWTIPFIQESGADYTAKITSVNIPTTVFDFSDSNFTIVANQVTVTSPNGGENWLASEEQVITWTDNLSGNVEIQLFKNDVFHSSIVTSTPSDGEYTWNIEVNTPTGSDYKVKILSVDDGSVFDLSDSNFTIINNELIVVTPNGGESWLTSSTQDITWTDDISGDVKIDLYKAGVFDSEVVEATRSDGTYSWTIPATVATGTDYKIRITSVDQPVLYDESDANFTIFTGGITVTSPNGGESWQAGTLQIITWTDNISEEVTIDLYKGGVFHSAISTPTPSDGSFDWTIPFTQESGSDYTVKITSADNPTTVFDFSDSNFTIVANQVTVTSPNGGENWLASEEQVITWTDNLSGNVEIQLFKNDVFHSSIVRSTPSDGEYTWSIPAVTPSASDYKVKLLSVDDGSVFDLSDANFTIISNELAVATPNGGESWLTNSTYDITWTDDISGDVKIDLYKAGVFDSEIVAATASDGSFSWNIPGTVATGTDYKIRITSVAQPVLYDESDVNFTIFTGGIVVSSPNGGEIWHAGSSQIIRWSDNITGNVMIDLYKGGVFHSVISSSTESSGSVDWNVPFTLESAADYMIKITSIDNPSTIFDFSDFNFMILGKHITVTSPNGGEQWLSTEEQMITWTDNFDGNVEIQLFKNDVFHSSIVTSTPSDGEYTWNTYQILTLH
jgi:surfactin synthase thioesterase subunit